MECGKALASLLSEAQIATPVEPSDELVGRAASMLEGFGFLRSIAGDEDHDAVAKAYASLVANQKGIKRGILFAGPVGVGKTHAATLFATHMRHPPVFLGPDTEVNVGAIMPDMLRNTDYGKAYVIDDLGRSADRMDYGNRSNPWLTFLYRWSGLHPTEAPILYVTTNLDSRNLAEYCGSAIMSRLVERLVICRLNGKDKRLTQTTLF